MTESFACFKDIWNPDIFLIIPDYILILTFREYKVQIGSKKRPEKNFVTYDGVFTLFPRYLEPWKLLNQVNIGIIMAHKMQVLVSLLEKINCPTNLYFELWQH